MCDRIAHTCAYDIILIIQYIMIMIIIHIVTFIIVKIIVHILILIIIILTIIVIILIIAPVGAVAVLCLEAVEPVLQYPRATLSFDHLFVPSAYRGRPRALSEDLANHLILPQDVPVPLLFCPIARPNGYHLLT